MDTSSSPLTTATLIVPVNETSAGGPKPLVSVLGQSIIYGITALLAVLSNGLNLVVLHRVPNCFDDVTQIILKFLALTDLLTGVFCTSLTIVVSILRHLQLNEVCAIRRCFCSSFVNISSLFVAFACLDRFLAITRPLHYHTIMTVRRARITILAIAIFGTLVGAFSVFPSSRTTLCISNFTSNSSLRFRPSVLVSITTFFGSLAIAMYTNTRVVAVAVHQTYRVTDEAVANGSAAGDAPVQRPKLRGLTAIVIATSAYCVAVIPWAIVSAAQMDPSTTISSPDVRFFTSLLLLSNSYWNPLIFALLSNKFRAAVKKTLGIKSEDNQNGNVTMSSIAAS
nr:probable G-protein coupled receptor 21 [Lytechinus pictus]